MVYKVKGKLSDAVLLDSKGNVVAEGKLEDMQALKRYKERPRQVLFRLPQDRKEILEEIALEQNLSQQALLEEAVQHLFIKYKKVD